MLSSSDWAKLQATLAFCIMAAVGGFSSLVIALHVLRTLRSDKADESVYFVWFVANLITFILSFIAIWPFVLFMNGTGSKYGSGFSLAVVACFLFLALTIGAYWARTQQGGGGSGPRRHHRHKRSKSSSAKRAKRHQKLEESGMESDHSQQLRSYAYDHPIYEVSSDVERGGEQ